MHSTVARWAAFPVFEPLSRISAPELLDVCVELMKGDPVVLQVERDGQLRYVTLITE